ncbi:cytochrome P450 [Gymnopilus junonius]|uniref:Cytochrome P450 n=1 Tax=Gymnopilus junonius TaxID=109634 RepID=A0A9P5NRS4_GYMJU|nr:cytochrome P450 [Gymnopilus junonius]
MIPITSVLDNAPLTAWLSLLLVLAFLLLIWNRGGFRWQTLKNVRGPPSGSWLYGHQVDFNRQMEVGDLDFTWFNEYGGAWKRNILMISDPAAIHHVIHTMGYGYPKTTENQTFTGLGFGRGHVAWAGGDTHVRHRKLLNPAFTAQAQRAFYPVFRCAAAQLTAQWKDKFQDSGDCSEFQTTNISRSLANATFDIICETVFDYHSGALDGNTDKNEFSEVFNNIFTDSNLFPSKIAILFAASWAYWPEALLRHVGNLPFRQFVRFKAFLTLGKKFGKDLIESKFTVVDGSKKRRDILSILVDANEANSKDERLSEDEVLSQVTQVTLIKEGLRMHPISPWITRESAIHNDIPLSEPVMGVDGKEITQVGVIPGQPVLVSTCAYNRHPAVWGADSDQWNPRRHLNHDMKEKRVPVGLYSNLLTFSGGPSGCIGWRFGLTEMQSILVELIENFEFCPPTNKNVKVLRTHAGALMAPMVKGGFNEGTQMPIGIRPL